MRCVTVRHDESSVHLSQRGRSAKVNPQLLRDSVVNIKYLLETVRHATYYRHVIGNMQFIGRMSAPVMLMHGSMAASKIGSLNFLHRAEPRDRGLTIEEGILWDRVPPYS